jgi:hypothetical protein
MCSYDLREQKAVKKGVKNKSLVGLSIRILTLRNSEREKVEHLFFKF